MMEIRNPIYTADGWIDCELNHPIYGWIPYTAEIDSEVFNAALKLSPAPYAAPDEISQLTDRRASTSLTRAEFCNVLKTAGVLSFEDALAAAKGDWPSQFASALSALPPELHEQIQITWAAVQTIDRLNPMILAVQAALGWSDAQADALFGIA